MPLLETTAAATPTARTPRALFTRGFDDFATWWHKNPANPASRDLAANLLAAEGLRVCDALIASPKVSFKVYGENLVLPKLIETFGIAGVEQLLEEDAVEFVLWRCGIGAPRRHAEPRNGPCPLLPVSLTVPEYGDPERSATAGLRMWSGASFRSLRRLARLAIERTWMPAERAPGDAVATVCGAHEAGHLTAAGFPAETPLRACSLPDLGRLRQLAERVLEGLVLARAGYAAHESAATWEAVRTVWGGAESLTTIEGIPSIGALVRKGAILAKDVPRLRRSEATEPLRRWMWAAPGTGASADAGKAYLAAVAPAVDAAAKGAVKTARLVTVHAPAHGGEKAGTCLRHLADEVPDGELLLRVPPPSSAGERGPNRAERRAAKARGFGHERRP